MEIGEYASIWDILIFFNKKQSPFELMPIYILDWI